MGSVSVVGPYQGFNEFHDCVVNDDYADKMRGSTGRWDLRYLIESTYILSSVTAHRRSVGAGDLCKR